MWIVLGIAAVLLLGFEAGFKVGGWEFGFYVRGFREGISAMISNKGDGGSRDEHY